MNILKFENMTDTRWPSFQQSLGDGPVQNATWVCRIEEIFRIRVLFGPLVERAQSSRGFPNSVRLLGEREPEHRPSIQGSVVEA